MTKFSFPALAAGPPSRRNWYKDLLDDPGCGGDALRVQEAYETHREAYFAKQSQNFTGAVSNPVTADKALIEHLARQSKRFKTAGDTSVSEDNDLDAQDVNCCVIWARPPSPVVSLILSLQQRLASLIGSELHVIPSKDLHLSTIELSHRHSVPHLRSVASEIGTDRIQNILDLVAFVKPKPELISPQLSFDKMGVALNFVPSADELYTYHHLRSDMHALALESGVSIDMCYTAPSAHVTLGRFIGNAFFETRAARNQFLELVTAINNELKAERESWVVEGFELQLGYLKFGRERAKADMIGKT